MGHGHDGGGFDPGDQGGVDDAAMLDPVARIGAWVRGLGALDGGEHHRDLAIAV